jgi:hypothetical protein
VTRYTDWVVRSAQFVTEARRAGSVDRSGDVVQLVRTLPCHGRGREFESRRPRHILKYLVRPGGTRR